MQSFYQNCGSRGINHVHVIFLRVQMMIILQCALGNDWADSSKQQDKIWVDDKSIFFSLMLSSLSSKKYWIYSWSRCLWLIRLGWKSAGLCPWCITYDWPDWVIQVHSATESYQSISRSLCSHFTAYILNKNHWINDSQAARPPILEPEKIHL